MEQLLTEGEDVLVYGYHPHPHMGATRLARLSGRLKLVQGDIRNRDPLGAAFRQQST